LIDHARALLSDYKVPQQIVFLEKLPKGLTGKVDRRCLRENLVVGATSSEVAAGVPV
jgi:acyl-coenzyme A synthetase/AMP-(fatty) acid ligase